MMAESTCRNCDKTFVYEWKGRTRRICPPCQEASRKEYDDAYNKNLINIKRRKRLMKIYRAVPANKERMKEKDRLRYKNNTERIKEGVRIYRHKSKKPKKRSDCIKGNRPCPWISCKHHMLWVMIPVTGNFKPDMVINKFIDKHTNEEILDIMGGLSESCTLDVAARDGQTLEEVSVIMGITRERVRQVEFCKEGGAIKRLRHHSKMKLIGDFRVSPHAET